MKNEDISISYLQSLSTADLLLLADDYGVDIPEHLNRSFVISELYEIAQEMKEIDEENELETNLKDTDITVDTSMELPETYNETQIDFVLRTPTWIYVFWDISKADTQNILEHEDFSKLLLKVYFWDGDGESNSYGENNGDSEKGGDVEKPIDSFEISVSENTKAQYIFIPSGKKEISVNIVAEMDDGKQEVLAEARKLKIPQEYQSISLESLNETEKPILELSGLKELKRKQYESHRESFM